MSTEHRPTQPASERMIRLRLLGSVLALAAGTAAVVIAVLYLRGVLG
jgi:hypothetical protein